MGTSILLALGLVVVLAVIAVSAFIAYATLLRLLRENAARRGPRAGDADSTRNVDDEHTR